MSSSNNRGSSGSPGRTVLLDHHRRHLRASGLSDETIASAELHSVSGKESGSLGFPAGLSGIGFPYPGTEVQVRGRKTRYYRLRVDSEQQRSPGQKYENPIRRKLEEGLTYYPYIPAAAMEIRKRVDVPVLLTEGEKKALKLTQEAWPAIGLPGVWMFTDPGSRKRGANKPLHPWLKRWRWRGRTVFVVFDSDRIRLLEVAQAEDRLCGLLSREGADVRVVRIPQPAAGKVGADDFLVAHGGAAFAKLLEEAVPWEPVAGLLDLVPRNVPVAALADHLVPVRRMLSRESATVRRAVTDRIAERWGLDDEAAVALLAPSRTDSGRPRVRVDGRQLVELVEEAWSAVLKSQFGPRLALHGSDIVLVEPERPRYQQVDAGKLEAILNRAAEWVRERNDELLDAMVPPALVRDMLAMPSDRLPDVDQVVGVPVLIPGDRLVAEYGYAGDGVFVAGAQEVLALGSRVPPRPTRADVATALSLLRDDLLGDFPFVDEASRTHTLAALLLSLVRPAIAGPTPLHLIEAPSAGTGKGLLAQVIHIVILGEPAPPTTLPRREEEMRKKITGMLLRGSPMVLLDNVLTGLASESLAAALTASVWRDRVLGGSDIVELANRPVWLLTANNPSISRELVRRCLRVRLDSGEERPWKRQGFKHERLDRWAMEHRWELLSALLVLLQAWRTAGRPPPSSRLGSFEAWSDIVGGVLEFAGCEGFLEGQGDLETFDPVEAAWGQLIHRWSTDLGGRKMSARDLHHLAVSCELDELVEDAGCGRGERTRFSRALAKLADRRFGDLAVRRGLDRATKSATYKLERTRPPRSPAPDRPGISDA